MPNASSPNVSDCQYYWGSVVDALACIYLYQNALTDEAQYRIRYVDFPDAIARARSAYYYCERFPHIPFGMVGDEIDDFFSDMLIYGHRLDARYSQALDNHCSGANPVPMRLL